MCVAGGGAIGSCEVWDPGITHLRATEPACTASSTHTSQGKEHVVPGKLGPSAPLVLLLVAVAKLRNSICEGERTLAPLKPASVQTALRLERDGE